jgi:dihydroflavonol-4-reductase
MHAGTTVFITGASGFLGSALLRQLVRRGCIVNALVRRSSRRDQLPESGVRYFEGDLLDRNSVARAVAGSRYAFHVAADYRLWALTPGETRVTNVEGARIVMQEAMRAGVERIVYTSSVATLGRSGPDDIADESILASERQAIGAYKRSKIAAERLVLEMIEHEGLPAIVVNPSTPIGPRDIRPTPTGRLVLEAAAGRIPAFVDTGLNLLHVDDAATGHIAALERGRIGERYILGGQNVLLSRMLHDIAEMMGRRGPWFRMPWYSALPIACGAEALACFTRREPLATIAGVRMARQRMFFTSAKAERELGLRSRPYSEALRDAVGWFRAAGYLSDAPLTRLSLERNHSSEEKSRQIS